MTIAIVGATGLVGRMMLRVLLERAFPYSTIRLFASGRSAGEVVTVGTESCTVESLEGASFAGIDVALFSAGGGVSSDWAKKFVDAGAVVVDNSSYWRMHPDVPLIVPEVNPADVQRHQGIIANPNCSTIQLVVALWPLHVAYGIQRVAVSTYQSVSGAGHKGVGQLQDELAGREPAQRITPHQLAYNAVFHTVPDVNAASEEEAKVVNETRRIMQMPSLRMSVTCVRIPVIGGHGEAVSIETERPCSPNAARDVLRAASGIVVMDDPAQDIYPTPLIANNTDGVYVGRIRRDDSVEHGLLCWIVADNLRKGAATNAVQIAELLLAKS